MKNNTFLFLFIAFTQLAFSQKSNESQILIKNLDTAFVTSNWPKVIKYTQLLDNQLKNKKLKERDSLLIISAMDACYKTAVAYTWLHKTDSALLLSEEFNVQKEYFSNHKNYALYFKKAASGQIAFINNRNNEAEKLFLEAYKVAKKDLGTNYDIYTNSVENLAIYYISEYQLQQATKLLYSTLLYFNQYNAKPVYQSRLYYLLYLVNYFDANYQSALDNANKCLFLLQKSGDKKESFLAAKAKLATGICLFHLNEYNNSKETLHQAWQLFSKYNYLTNQEFALNLNYLGRVYYLLKNYSLAMEYKLKVRKIFEEIYPSPTHFRILQVATSSLYAMENRVNIEIQGIDSETYEQLTDFEYVFKHLPVNYQNMSNVHQLYFYGSQALTYARNKQYTDAIIYLKKGLFLRKKSYPQYHLLLRPWYKLIANCYAISGSHDSAIVYYNKAIESFKYTGNQPHQQGKPATGFIKSPELINLFYSVGKSYFFKAKQEQNSRKYFEKALVYFKNCDNLTSQIAALQNNTEDKLLLAAYMDDVYNFGITCCFNLFNGDEKESDNEEFKEQAFIFSQRSKVNLLEEMVTKFDIQKKLGLPKQITEQEKNIKDKISYWEKVISERTIVKTDSFEHPLIYYRKRINDHRFNNSEANDSLYKYTSLHNKLLKKIEQKFPGYFNLLYSKKIYSVSEIQSYLNSSSVLIDYHLNDEYIEAFVISKSDFSSFRVKIPAGFKSIIDDYTYSISGYYKKNDFMNKALETFIKNGHSLYQFLIKPLEQKIENKEKLIIIVSKELALMPFETLVSTDKAQQETDLATLNYLIKKHSITYNYSTNLLIESIKRSNINKTKIPDFLGIAPVFDPDRMLIAGNLENDDNDSKMQPATKIRLSKLSATKSAIDDISVLANKNKINCTKFYYQNASKSAFLNNVSNKKYVLLATHGKADYENPKLSGFYFALNDTSRNYENNILFSYETYNLNLNNDLMVLFACETGTGQLKEGEGVMTLSRGLMASGVANIVHSLWSIQDISTRDVVVNFFSDVFNHSEYASSLRNAKLKMIEYGIPPFHWAGLVLLGN